MFYGSKNMLHVDIMYMESYELQKSHFEAIAAIADCNARPMKVKRELSRSLLATSSACLEQSKCYTGELKGMSTVVITASDLGWIWPALL